MTRRVLVTGATGFIGRSVVPLLESSGCAVAGLSRKEVDQGAQYVFDTVRDFGPDVIVHLATHFLSVHQPRDIPALVRANVEFGTTIAEAASTVGCRLVNVETAWQHVDGQAYNPMSLYAATKQALSVILEFYASTRSLDVRTATLFDTYGPGDTRGKLVPLLLQATQHGSPLDMSDGGQLIDLTYVDDVARGLVGMACRADAPQQTVFRSWQPVTVREVVATVENAVNAPVPVVWDRRPRREREMRSDWVFGSSPGWWRAEVPLVEGVRRTWTAMFQAGSG